MRQLNPFYLAVLLILLLIPILIFLQIQPDSKAIHVENDIKKNTIIQERLEENMKNTCNLLLTGDSITMRFETTAPDAWNRYILPHHPINFGIDGDNTLNLMDRLQSDEIDRISPEFCTVLIGINDLLIGDAPPTVPDRIYKISVLLAIRYPASTILLYSIFPAEKYPGSIRKKIDETNRILSGLQYPEQVRLIDLSDRFLSEIKS